jgi:hypothetical protein
MKDKLKVLFLILIVIGVLGSIPALVMILWNLSLAAIFVAVPKITYFQSLWLVLLTSLLFKPVIKINKK